MTMLKVVFSVIVPTHNRPHVLARTLDFLEGQHADVAFEVIVVDDCSTAALPDLGLGRGGRASWMLLRNARNLGRAATRNRGIRKARGEYILMIDDDIWASAGLLQAHYEAQTRIGGGVVVGSLPIASGVKRDIWNEYHRSWVDGLHKTMKTRRDDLPYNFFFTGNVSIPRKLLEDAGLFDESFPGYSGEDTELGYRLKKMGVRFIHEPLAIGEHYDIETLESLLFKSRQMGRAAFVLARLHPELSRELSVAGLLAPGRAWYQLFMSGRLLSPVRVLCRIMGALRLNAPCLFFLRKLREAYGGLGLKEAINAD